MTQTGDSGSIGHREEWKDSFQVFFTLDFAFFLCRRRNRKYFVGYTYAINFFFFFAL